MAPLSVRVTISASFHGFVNQGCTENNPAQRRTSPLPQKTFFSVFTFVLVLDFCFSCAFFFMRFISFFLILGENYALLYAYFGNDVLTSVAIPITHEHTAI